MKARISGLILGLVSILAQGQDQAQQGVQIGFEGPPQLAPGTGRLIPEYAESGMWFRPLVGGDHGVLGRARGGENRPAIPDNGTAYLADGGSSPVFGFANASVFDLVSVDLVENGMSSEPLEVWFIGYRPDGSTVTTVLTTDGVRDGAGPLADFETFRFDDRFRGLARVEIPSHSWALDNLVVAVPEPGFSVLLLLGGIVFGARKLRD